MQQPEKILIIDDEEPNREIICSMLQEHYSVESAEDGEKGLEIARQFRPTIILLDIMMPGIDGYEVCKIIREDPGLSRIKIILVSGKGALADRLRGYEAGADDFISKPFDEDELQAKIAVFSRLNQEERKSRQLNRLLLMRQQDIPNILWECDTGLMFTFVDETIQSLLGYNPEDLLGHPIGELLQQDTGGLTKALSDKLATSSRLHGVMYAFKTAKGEALPLQVYADTLFDDYGNVSGMGGVLRDMSAFSQLLECHESHYDQLSIHIDPSYTLTCENDLVEMLFQSSPVGNKKSLDIRDYLCDPSVTNLLDFAFDQTENVPFPVEISLPDEEGIDHLYTIEFVYLPDGPFLKGELLPSSAQDQLQMVSHRIENQSQRIKDQEESLKNAFIMDNETKDHILKDAHNLAAEILALVKSLETFAFPDDGLFNMEEYTQFVSNRNLYVYQENLRLLGNKIHSLKGSCGFLIPEAKALCHQMEEVTRPLADAELVFTRSLANLLKQFIFKIEEMLEGLVSQNDYEMDVDNWLERIKSFLNTGLAFVGKNASEVAKLIRERSTDHGELRARKREEFLSVSLDGYESLADKVKELYYVLSEALNKEKLVQAGTFFNHFLSTHQDIKKVPLVLTRYERLIPKLAEDYSKESDFQFIDHGVKADREFWDSIHEILNHMLKNSVIHGIENAEKRKEAGKSAPGRVAVELEEDALHIILTISDDGKGIDSGVIAQKALERGLVSADLLESMSEHEIFDLLFLQGLSTAESLDDNAGRGVGMNAVKEVMQQLQGECKISSTPGQGSQWQFSFLKSNVSLACIIVSIGDFTLAIPEDYVETFLNFREQDRHTVKQAPAYQYNGSLIPLIDADTLFNTEEAEIDRKNRSIIVLKNNTEKRGMIINRILDHAVQPILPLPKIYRDVPIYQGITFYNNEPVQVINIDKIF